jgi:hypothetical protein
MLVLLKINTKGGSILMLYKELICPVCRGYGFISRTSDNAAWSEPCTNCYKGSIVEPITNGDLIRGCTNEQLAKVYENINSNALYSGGERNRLLATTGEDFLLWLDKAADDVDLQTIFDFINVKDYEHPWLRVVPNVVQNNFT